MIQSRISHEINYGGNLYKNCTITCKSYELFKEELFMYRQQGIYKVVPFNVSICSVFCRSFLQGNEVCIAEVTWRYWPFISAGHFAVRCVSS